ncbi:PLP-dependent aspartate aminotransferase family protein [Labrenzia sp. DG1229]|uniref:trans-sulfuration enzyme family protein n=1 Tax=Labrenzia sp. DG1229 TaxID=681847 RepID=UPI0007C6B5D4|nr:PLP-dependent aspartate aminotransferase family protein [Labrenzia sp. DG1229]
MKYSGKHINKTSDLTRGWQSLSPATYRGSTVVYPDYRSFINRGAGGRKAYTYGLAGTPTSRTLEARLSELEAAIDTFLVPSGLLAVTLTMLSVLEPGDKVAIPETVYGPVRRFAHETLLKLGIQTHYYDPRETQNIPFDDPHLRLIWIESPGSITMEVQDITGICKKASQKGILVGCDNSWASPFLCKPIKLGADLVVEAVSKTLSGHSDLLMGSISVGSEPLAEKIHGTIRALGVGVSPDDCFLALRGMETAELRLAHAGHSARLIAEQLNSPDGFPLVDKVLHPELSNAANQALWETQYVGSNGVFSLILKDEEDEAHAARYSSLETFSLGASWGGTHSLLAPSVITDNRCAGRYDGKRFLRLSVGLEPVELLAGDLDQFFAGPTR